MIVRGAVIVSSWAPGRVLKWTGVVFLTLIEVLILIFLTAWVVGYL